MNSFNLINLKSFIIALITFFTFANSEQCRKYKCGNLTNNICLKLNYTIDNGEITGELCENKNLECHYSDFSNDQVSCQLPKNITVLQYPGGLCQSKNDCINGGECNNGICQGSKEIQTCMDNST